MRSLYSDSQRQAGWEIIPTMQRNGTGKEWNHIMAGLVSDSQWNRNNILEPCYTSAQTDFFCALRNIHFGIIIFMSKHDACDHAFPAGLIIGYKVNNISLKKCSIMPPSVMLNENRLFGSTSMLNKVPHPSSSHLLVFGTYPSQPFLSLYLPTHLENSRQTSGFEWDKLIK